MSGPKDREYNFLAAFHMHKSAKSVIPRDEAEARIVNLKLKNYRLETAKISEAVDATIQFLKMMHDEILESDPKQAQIYLQQSIDIQNAKQEFGFDQAAAIVAGATIKRSVKDPSTMAKVEESMAKINKMMEILTAVKPDIIELDINARNKQTKFKMLNNLASSVISFGQLFAKRLNRRVDTQQRRVKQSKGPRIG